MSPSQCPLCPPEPTSARLDLCAAGLSTLCLLHCLALPLLATLMPLAAQVAESELAHRILAASAIPVSFGVVWKTSRVDSNGAFVGAVMSGLGLLLLAAFVEAVSTYEEPITVAGGVLLCSAHLWHWMQQRGKRDFHGVLVEADER